MGRLFGWLCLRDLLFTDEPVAERDESGLYLFWCVTSVFDVSLDSNGYTDHCS